MRDLLPYAVPRLPAIFWTDTDKNDIKRSATKDYSKSIEASLKEILAAIPY
jgi:hypothetical protein